MNSQPLVSPWHRTTATLPQVGQECVNSVTGKRCLRQHGYAQRRSITAGKWNGLIRKFLTMLELCGNYVIEMQVDNSYNERIQVKHDQVQDRTNLVLVPVLISSVLTVLIKYWDQDEVNSTLFSVHLVHVNVPIRHSLYGNLNKPQMKCPRPFLIKLPCPKIRIHTYLFAGYVQNINAIAQVGVILA